MFSKFSYIQGMYLQWTIYIYINIYIVAWGILGLVLEIIPVLIKIRQTDIHRIGNENLSILYVTFRR